MKGHEHRKDGGKNGDPKDRRPREIPVKVDVDLPEELGTEPRLYVFDDDDRLVAALDPRYPKKAGGIPGELAGRTVTAFLAPSFEAEDRRTPSAERLRRAGFPERRGVVTEKLVDLGKLTLHPHLLLRSCCRVRGRVFKTVDLPGGGQRRVPLCNARVKICEVDLTPWSILRKIPDDLILRTRRELLEQALVHDPARVETRTLSAGQADLLARAETVTATRAFLAEHLELARPIFCRYDWLFRRVDLDCLRTVHLGPDGRFDTHIHYWCYGDKPDLYFEVEQACLDGDTGWTSVHSPPVRCSTHWNYCCGEEVEIEVTDPRAAFGPVAEPCDWPVAPGDPSSDGEWELLPYDSGAFAVHAALLRTGKVLFFSGGAETQLPLESRVWDPVTGTLSSQTFQDDLFCADQVVLADGRVLVLGGSNYNGPNGRGIDASYTFDPLSESWSKHADLTHGRWYPTAVLLPDGRVVALSGRPAAGPVVDEMEIFDPATDTWSVLPATANKEVPIYPSLHLMKGGELVYTGCRWAGATRTWPSPPDTALFDPATNTWFDIATHVIPNRTEGTSVLLPAARAMSMEGHEHGEELPPPPSQQRVLVLGGECGSPAERASAEILDLADESPAWRRIDDMAFPRVNPNAVVLPDRSILVVGGVRKYKFDWNPEPVLEAELFDPTSETWRTVAAMSTARQYHSVALLLPDGRVLLTGTTSRSGNDMSMEVYSPPYLFRGPRPRITGHPGGVGYGEMLEISTPDACRVTEVCLVRPGAITHHTDTDQRYVQLHLHHAAHCTVKAMVPNDPTLAPPGFYMLFVVDGCGVPSEGKFVRLS